MVSAKRGGAHPLADPTGNTVRPKRDNCGCATTQCLCAAFQLNDDENITLARSHVLIVLLTVQLRTMPLWKLHLTTRTLAYAPHLQALQSLEHEDVDCQIVMAQDIVWWSDGRKDTTTNDRARRKQESHRLHTSWRHSANSPSLSAQMAQHAAEGAAAAIASEGKSTGVTSRHATRCYKRRLLLTRVAPCHVGTGGNEITIE
jgi:hypothetical protein